MSKICKWDGWWRHTLNPILSQVHKWRYLGQFAAQILETWQANSSIRNTPAAMKILFPWQLTLFQSPPTLLQYVGDFQLEKRWTGPQTGANLFICLLDHTYEAPFANMKIEHWRWPEMPLILGRSGTQYVPMITKLLCSYYVAPLVDPYCKESNISVTNWLKYLFSSYSIKIWLSIWRHYLANLHILKTWISLERKEIFENSKRHFSSHINYLFML